MKSNTIKRISVGILMLLVLLTGVYGCTSKTVAVSGNGPADVNEEKKFDYSSFKELSLNKDDIKIKFEGKNLDTTLPVYVENNRYYLPLTEIVERLEGEIIKEGDIVKISLNGNEISINTKDNNFTINDKTRNLKKKLMISEDIVYISMFDFTRILNLKTDWSLDNKTIAFFKKREKIDKKEVGDSPKTALIRIEDIGVSKNYRYVNEETLEKLRIVSDYMYSEGIPFHVAWVPRYMDPKRNEDNDLTKENNMYYSDFLFTLDYFEDRGGLIGLHGYTHQAGDDASIEGKEFANPKDPKSYTKEFTEERIKEACDTAKKLDIKPYFFETGHYAGSDDNFRVIEKDFDYIYQPKKDGTKYIASVKNENRTAKYIPAYLDCIDGKQDTDNMLNKINKLPADVMASFFYHPNIEFEDIKITKDDTGYPTYTYSEESTLHRVVKLLESKGYKFKKITDL